MLSEDGEKFILILENLGKLYIFMDTECKSKTRVVKVSIFSPWKMLAGEQWFT